MGAHLQRGRLLLGQSRFDLALKEFQQELAENPGCPISHALAALCLIQEKKLSEALALAQKAVGLGPDQDIPYYALAKVRYAQGEIGSALQAIDEASRIDPNEADWRAFRSACLYDLRRWKESLDVAEEGLRLNALHVGCQNLRGMALLKLGRRGDAQKSLQSTLAISPESPGAHATMGWSQLEAGNVPTALQHFAEALRIDPQSRNARSGLVAALKARYPVYRWMLSYFFWASRHSRATRFAVLLGVWFAIGSLGRIGGREETMVPIVGALGLLWVMFLLMTWLADPLFNLLLLFHSVGRHALSDDQRRTAQSLGILFASAGTILLLCVVLGSGEGGYFLAAAVACLVLPQSAIRRVSKGWRRTVVAILAALLSVAVLSLGIGGLFASTEANRTVAEQTVFALSLVGSIPILLVTNLLRTTTRGSV